MNQQMQKRNYLCTLCCLFCCLPSPDQVTAKISTLKSGFVLGEEIVFSVEVDNLSGSILGHSYVQLIQIIVYHAEDRTKTNKQVIARIKNEGILRVTWYQSILLN